MKIKYLVSMAGTAVVFSAGQIADINVDEARRLVDAGFVEALEEFPVVETGSDPAAGEPASGLEAAVDQTETEQAIADPDPEAAVADVSGLEKRVKASKA